MKKILLPTDFSENAYNALCYGLKIAQKTGADVLFFHANHVPIIIPDTPTTMYESVIANEDKRQLEALVKLKDKLFKQLNITPEQVKADCMVKPGFAVDAIVEVVKDENIGLIVMGTKGASGIKKLLLGSNTASIIKKVDCPVLAVPDTAQFKGIDKIVFATDYHEINDKNVLTPLVEMALLFDSELLIFNVKEEEEQVPSVSQAAEGLKIETAFKPVNHSYHFSEDGDIPEAIEEFVEKTNADLLVLMPHRPNLFEQLFTTSVTKEIAFQTKIPLLTLPERAKKR